jgi:hypothetical protein
MGGRRMLETTPTKILVKRLEGWRSLLDGRAPRRYFTVGDCERAIADIERELQRRADQLEAKP